MKFKRIHNGGRNQERVFVLFAEHVCGHLLTNYTVTAGVTPKCLHTAFPISLPCASLKQYAQKNLLAKWNRNAVLLCGARVWANLFNMQPAYRLHGNTISFQLQHCPLPPAAQLIYLFYSPKKRIGSTN